MSTTLGPSPAQLSDQIRHASQDRRPSIIAVGSVMMVLAVIAVFGRFWSRRMSGQKIKIDDWCIVAALIFQCVDCLLLMIATRFGYGRHIFWIGLAGVPKFLKLEFAFELLYCVGTALTKASLLLFYRRIFQLPKFKMAVNVLGVYVTIWFIGSFLTALFECTPVSHFYNRFTPGRCIRPLVFQEIYSAFNILCDVLLLILPMPVVWKLQVSQSQKIALSGIFLVGGFVCLASIIRAPYLRDTEDTVDPTYTNVNGGIWSLIELSVGVICANLPIMRPLLHKYIAKPISRARALYSHSYRNTPENTGEKQHPISLRKVTPKKSQSSTLFSSQASTQVQSQLQSEYQPEPKEVEAPGTRGWRSFMPHKESRFIGGTTFGSVADNTRIDSAQEEEEPISMGEIRVRQDVEWRRSEHLISPNHSTMPRIPEPAVTNTTSGKQEHV